jgi:hypothetical protein
MKFLPHAEGQNVHHDPYEVDRELAALGLSRKPTIRAVKQGELHRRLATPLDPPSAAGTFAWIFTLRGLSEEYVPKGWRRSDKGLSTIMNPNGTVAIAVVSGDEGTGLVDGEPASRYSRGPATIEVIMENGQGALFDIDPLVTWFLLINSGSDGVYAELSQPEAVDSTGRVSEWKTRIVLGRVEPTEPEGFGRKPDAPPVPDPVDVPVTRRAQ